MTNDHDDGLLDLSHVSSWATDWTLFRYAHPLRLAGSGQM